MSREERVARNETLFREVNERIEQVNRDMVEPEGEADFLCECGDPECTAPVSLTLAEYEEVRGEATHFAIVPGHSDPSVEIVVAVNERFAVVEKVDPDAARIAVREDPRSDA
jgi:hypothetical protein